MNINSLCSLLCMLILAGNMALTAIAQRRRHADVHAHVLQIYIVGIAYCGHHRVVFIDQHCCSSCCCSRLIIIDRHMAKVRLRAQMETAIQWSIK